MALAAVTNYEAALTDAMGWIRKGWTQGAYCRNKAGVPCSTDGPGIRRVDICWALDRSARDRGLDPEALRSLVRAQLPRKFRIDQLAGLERWNDQEWRTRTEVIIVLERTIEALR